MSVGLRSPVEVSKGLQAHVKPIPRAVAQSVLEEDRNTAEPSLQNRWVVSFLPRPCEAGMDHRVERGVQPLDVRDGLLDEVSRTACTRTHKLCLRDRIDRESDHQAAAASADRPPISEMPTAIAVTDGIFGPGRRQCGRSGPSRW